MQTHDFTATYQECIVSQIDPSRHRLKVQMPALENLESDWLPMITPNAGANQFYALPDVGELVVAILDARGESGVVLGAIYNDVDTPPVKNGQMWVKKFTNGTIISHNRQNGQIIIETKGDVIVKSARQVTLDVPNTIITGDVQVAGKLTANVDVVGGGVSLKNHTHGGVMGGNGKTGKPSS